MTQENLIRWSGPITILAGILYVIGALLHPTGEDLAAFAQTRWVPAHLIYWVSLVLLNLGLVGINLRLAAGNGWLIKIAFLLAFVGTSLVSSIVLFNATAGPMIAELAPDILAQVLSFPPFLLLIFLVGFGLGYILLGIALLRSDVLPRGTGILLIVGVVLFIVSEMDLLDRQLAHLSVTIGDILFGTGLAWIGFSLWKEESPPEKSAAAQD